METQRIRIRSTRPQRQIFNTPERFVIITKGRRFGATKGAANYFIKWLVNGTAPLLWVDTINGNIDRYFDRYFAPVLREQGIDYEFNRQKKQLLIMGNYCDFRSADRPESIEGFGYKKIFLNEAGIILKNDYLYTNAILPMMMDFSDAQLIAAGAPKGKIKKDGTEHKFWTLYKRALTEPGFKAYKFSSYDNPLLSRDDIKDLELEMSAMSDEDVQQEIYGEFVDKSGSNPFLFRYDPKLHEGTTVFDPRKPVYIGMDFNLNPFGFVYGHIWEDGDGRHFHIFDEESIPNANIDMAIDYIRSKYGSVLHTIMLTGDSMGNRRDFGQKDNATYYERLERGLGLRKNQLRLPPNPTHENSRADCNFMLANLDFKVDPKNCPITAYELAHTQADAFGSLLKKNRNDLSQRGDMCDSVRYLVNSFLFDWIRRKNR